MKWVTTPNDGDNAAGIYISYMPRSAVGLSQINEVILFDLNTTLLTGIKTQAGVDALCEHLQRLKIHLP